MRRSILRSSLAAAAVLGALSYTPGAAADPTRFEFTLFSHASFGGEQLFSDGGGFFLVEGNAIPAAGTAVLVASDLGGTAGLATAGRSSPFGYAYGNTFEFFVGSPLDNNIDVIRTPHEDAQVTFTDGVVTGISYTETHRCSTGHHCQPGYTEAGSMFMNGLSYEFMQSYPHVSAGPIVVAIPETGTAPLMLAGMALLAAGWARLRRGRGHAGR